jgi:ABC-type transport system substrate-binding protein
MDVLEQGVRASIRPTPTTGATCLVSVDYSFITDSAVSFEAYKNNEFDIIGSGRRRSGSRQADPVLSQQANIYPGSCTFAVMFHQLKEPFTDQKVREAFAHALDREPGCRRAARSGQPDPDLDSAGLPWLRRRGEPLGLRSRGRQGRPSPSPATAASKTCPRSRLTFWRHAAQPHPLTSGWRPSGRKYLGVDIALDPVEPPPTPR